MSAVTEPSTTDTASPERTSVDTPTAVTGRHLPALDGIRAVAVAGVIAYHLGAPWASGGYLGVDLFFVLSGFLITSLLIEEWVARGRVSLAAFWARRARRLLPALFLLLVALAVFVVVLGRFGSATSIAHIDLSGLRGDALATLFYVANWHAIFAHQSYFAQYAAPSPLEQTWSLAIEEQFYLVWPLLLLALLALWRRGRRRADRGLGRLRTTEGWRWLVGSVALVAGIGSALLMALLYEPGTDPTRVYFGTDTRMFDLLAGVLVAVVAAARPQPSRRARTVLHAAAPLAAGGLAWFWVTGGTPERLPTAAMFDGGFALCAALAAVVVADVRQVHRGPLGTVLSLPPLRWLGTISYGVYLWHWPIIVYVTRGRTGLGGALLDVVRVALTLAIATASYFVVERPLRRRRFAGWPRFTLAPLVAAGTAAVVVVATFPAVAVPVAARATSDIRVAATRAVPGSGGFNGQRAITVPPFSPSNPLRVTVFGDSVAKVAEPAISAALEATGEITVTNAAIDGFGLNIDRAWATGIPKLIASDRSQVVLATWSWDDSCSARHPSTIAHYATFVCALQHPRAYTAMLERAVRLMLGPGGASGVVFLEFPPTGPAGAAGRAKRAGETAWNRIVESLPAVFPGKVMYLPVASAVLLHGHFTSWLPPEGAPRAPKPEWVRVRMVDDVHLCPAGAARYANAVLADLSTLFHLPAAGTGWSTGPWTGSVVYNTPPGSCPDDHPPA
ncbi:MAG: acyltransferase [Actinomycetota bacterium]|nr:acyltransferase [Actinomycetota bacterium]